MHIPFTYIISLLTIFISTLLPHVLNPNVDHILENEYNSNKKIKSELEKMVYIDGGSFLQGFVSDFDINLISADSTLLTGNGPRRSDLSSYYITATEVTNAEWQLFYQDMVEEMGESKAKHTYFPDTSIWVKEFPYSYNRPMAEQYYAHKKFKDFPVVGITWEQANAYCKWKSTKVNALLAQQGIQANLEFRLPSEAEWEYAAMKNNNVKDLKNHPIYPWPEGNEFWNIRKLANLGQIKDINGLIIKDYGDDGCLYTCEVASYSQNVRGLYDMAGNVAEWTSDEGYTNSFNERNGQIKKLTTSEEILAEIEYIKLLHKDDVELKEYLISKHTHDSKVLKNGQSKICKGGSWAGGLIYIQIGSRQAIPKDRSSSTIGFRVAISNVSQEAMANFPKKKWKPI